MISETEATALMREFFASPEAGPRRLEIYYLLKGDIGTDKLRELYNRLEPKPEPKTAKKGSKKQGKFKTRRLKNFPDYVIDENGRVTGPAGTELKYRWNYGKPFVSLNGKDRSVHWLLIEVGFQESPADKRERRALAKRDDRAVIPKCFNDAAEAIAEDPELYADAIAEDPESYGLDDEGNEVD